MCHTYNPRGAYICTLPAGHTGPHIATDEHVICTDLWAIWRDLAHPSLRVSEGL